MAVDLLFRGVRPIYTRRNRNFNLNDNLLDGLSEAEVKSRYRFSRDSIQYITDTLAPIHNEPHRLSNQKNFIYQAEIGD